MLFRLLFPYAFLLLVIACYLAFRQYKLGPLIMKIERHYLSRANSDSFVLIVVLAVASYFLMRYEIKILPAEAANFLFGPITFAVFYPVLLAAVIAREVESPQIRKKGLATARGFWLWSEVESFRFSKDILHLSLKRGKRRRDEEMQIKAGTKKELTRILKETMPKRSGKGKK